jgi:hypothetical protein
MLTKKCGLYIKEFNIYIMSSSKCVRKPWHLVLVVVVFSNCLIFSLLKGDAPQLKPGHRKLTEVDFKASV